ncbi:MAG: O-antigen ligase family protein [Pseudomonadota bacterium]|nr:O-antigen ligase family protein [Pseudomonadota bacterium]
MIEFGRETPQFVPKEGGLKYAPLSAPAGGRLGSKQMDMLADVLSWGLPAFVFLIAVPQGANSALAWIGATLVLSMTGMIYFLIRAFCVPHRLIELRHHRGIACLGGAVLIAAGWGLLPVPVRPLSGLPNDVQPNHISLAVGAGQLALLRLASYAMLFVLMTEVCANPRRAERMLTLLYVGFVAHAAWALLSLYALGDTLLLGDKPAYQGVATGTFVNRNSFASFMAMGAVIGTARLAAMTLSAERAFLPRASNGPVVLQVLGLLLILSALAATGSRMGVFSALIAISSVISFLAIKARTPSRRTGLVLCLGAFVLVIFILSAFGQAMLERLVFVPADWEVRLALYRQTWAMIMARPWTGYGVDGFHVAFEMFHQPDLRMDRAWQLPHNTYLSLWVDYGIPLGSSTLVLVGAVFVKLLRALRQRQHGYGPAAIGCAVIILAAVHSLADFSFEIAANVYVFIALVCLGLAPERGSEGTEGKPDDMARMETGRGL